MPVRFGDFVLDRGTRQLLRGDEPRALGPKAFDLLDLLLEHRPNVVPKERIRHRLWPATFVSESTLATVVQEVRSALGDDARKPDFVRTVHGVGYAFFAPARDTGTAAPVESKSYRLLVEGREVALQPGENLIGRVDQGTVWLDSPSVSRRHARIVIADSATLEDLGSKNGTFVGGQRISKPTPLSDGDEFRVGRVSLRLRVFGADELTLTDGG